MPMKFQEGLAIWGWKRLPFACQHRDSNQSVISSMVVLIMFLPSLKNLTQDKIQNENDKLIDLQLRSSLHGIFGPKFQGE